MPAVCAPTSVRIARQPTSVRHREAANLTTSIITVTMVAPTIRIRPAQRVPEHIVGVETVSTDPRHVVHFRHPAYPTAKNRLFSLLALDHPTGGIHSTTAHTACAIIAGNRFDGYLSLTATGEPIRAGSYSVLTGSDYFFCVPTPKGTTGTYKYPVVPNFTE